MTVSDGIGRANRFFWRAFRQQALQWQEQKHKAQKH